MLYKPSPDELQPRPFLVLDKRQTSIDKWFFGDPSRGGQIDMSWQEGSKFNLTQNVATCALLWHKSFYMPLHENVFLPLKAVPYLKHNGHRYQISQVQAKRGGKEVICQWHPGGEFQYLLISTLNRFDHLPYWCLLLSFAWVRGVFYGLLALQRASKCHGRGENHPGAWADSFISILVALLGKCYQLSKPVDRNFAVREGCLQSSLLWSPPSAILNALLTVQRSGATDLL